MGSDGGLFKWSDANTADLILWRISNSGLFTGRRNAAIKAFELYVREKELEGKVTPPWVRKKWENLKQKYKDLKSLNMVGGDRNNYLEVDAPPTKQSKANDWPMALREMHRLHEERERRAAEREDERDKRAAAREDERDRRAAEREAERDRRAAEREAERERQALEREERRERDMFAREERWEKEMLAREERQEKEYREGEERREKQAAAREEKLFKILETFLSNK
ncbi:uncharacterized protein si:ch73-193c12.2 [Triplophysa dalaica]|uniref:uncharacterized protein si:ch73-193c12.2 n=1 Tax=Triplophysa dalaica TaxID=1582913 RepID=UPI0024E0233F|nr:uncharacterized protein si:ch73-193c12.2 [Triplophysa dalaica]